MLINDRLSTILTQHAGEMAFVQRSLIIFIGGLSQITLKTILKGVI